MPNDLKKHKESLQSYMNDAIKRIQARIKVFSESPELIPNNLDDKIETCFNQKQKLHRKVLFEKLQEFSDSEIVIKGVKNIEQKTLFLNKEKEQRYLGVFSNLCSF